MPSPEKISVLTGIATVAYDDVIPIVDSSIGTTRKVTVAGLLNALWNGSGNRAVVVDPSTGYVGIGTTAPGAKLEIYDTTDALTYLKFNDLSWGTSGQRKSILWSQGAIDLVKIEALSPSPGKADLRFSTYNSGLHTDMVTFQNTGSVLIGATAAVGSELLRVNGQIYSDGNISGLSFTDRTPFPESPAIAWAAIKSMRHDGKGGVDHAALHDFIRAESKRITEDKDGKETESVDVGRNLSGTISCLVLALQDAEQRIKILEKAA